MTEEDEHIEPNKTLVRSIRRNLKNLEQYELVDLIHTTVVAASLSKTDEGRKVHASTLVGYIGLIAPKIGDEAAAELIGAANETAVAIMEALAHYQKDRCSQCPESDMCVGAELSKPPIIH